MADKKLYRSNSDVKIAGVCAGVADYLELDSTMVRLIWVLLFLVGGSGLLFYIAAWIIMPVRPTEPPTSNSNE